MNERLFSMLPSDGLRPDGIPDALEPVADASRLAALDALGILDTPPERGFDDIVHLSRRLCDVPVALVSFVDRDRQWFKARAGFPACETDLDRSVCKFVLAEDDVLQIPDLADDPRTRANPLVTGEPFIRFYAGAPLRTPDGHALGSLCVIDHAPRPSGLTATQAEDLKALARQVMDQLLLRRSMAERDRKDTQREAVAWTLSEVASAGGELDASLRAVLAGAMRAVSAAEAGAVEIRENDELILRAVTNDLASHLGLHLPLRGSLAGACLVDDVPMLVPDVLLDARVKRDLVEPMRIRSCVLVPVRRGRVPIGVLRLQASRPGAFTDEDVRLAEVFAGAVSAGLAESGEAEARRVAAQTEHRRRAVFDSVIDYAIIVMDLDGNVTDWNAGAAAILGWRSDEMCGRPVDAFFTAEDRADGIPAKEMQAALEKGVGVDERWHLRRDGERFWANGEMMALRDDDGRAIGFVKILRDRTGQRLAAERLQQANERLQMALTASGNVGLWDWIVDTDLLHGDAHFARLYGLDAASTAAGVTMEQYQEFVVPEDIPGLRAAIRNTFEHGVDFLVEYRLAIPGLPLRWVECKGRLIHDETGRSVRFSGTAVDVSARKNADAETKKLAAIVAQSSDFIGIADADRRIEWINEAGLRMVGFPGASATGTDWVSFHSAATCAYVEDVVAPALKKDGHWRGELRMRRFDTGAEFPVLYDLAAIRDASGRVIGYATGARDITEQKRAEEYQELLNHELSHRMKNLLAMVQAIASSTLRGATDIEAAREVLGSRLIALGKAHDVLLGGAAERAPLPAVVREGVGVQESAGERVSYEGPDIEIGGKAALSLALTLHELTTNAVKYGALSVPEGRVSVTATLLDCEDGPALRIAWTERGGPPVRPPSRKGFGSRLIERGLTAQVGGRIALDYAPEGVTCIVEAPLEGFQASD